MSLFLRLTAFVRGGSVQRATSICGVAKATPSWTKTSTLHTTACNERRSFFLQTTAAVLWKTQTSVSSQGRARGRARGLLKKKNLNRGQHMGIGKAKISWPGLTAHVSSKKGELQIAKIEEDKYKAYEDGIAELRAKEGSGRRLQRKSTALERGWSGATAKGKKFGPPIAPNSAYNYDQFETILIEHKLVSHMEKTGRIHSHSLLMVTGNRNGLAGFALTNKESGKGPMPFQKAVNRAGLKLCHIPRYEDRTVFHDFYTQFGNCRLFVKQRPPGFGVKAHRTIKAACEMIGLKDLEVSIDGRARSYTNIIKCFFLGLLRQRSHQELADEKKLHLVELRAENGYFPKVVASPSEGHVRTKEELLPNEVLDFETISYEGQLPYIKPTRREVRSSGIATFTDFYKTQKKENQEIYKLHQYDQKLQMLVDYGRIGSYLTEIYPECRRLTLAERKKLKEETSA